MLILLLIEDNPQDVLLIHHEFEQAYGTDHVQFTDCARLKDALAVLSQKHFDLILLDLTLEDSTSAETLGKMFEIVATARGTPIVVITGIGGAKDMVSGSLGLLNKGPDFVRRLARVTRPNVPLEEKLTKLRSLTAAISAYAATETRPG
jgi:CheY-like chemotaxis protein